MSLKLLKSHKSGQQNTAIEWFRIFKTAVRCF
jgi:hypothetical protein